MQGDFLDTYHNLSYKAVMGNLWVAEFCSQAEFVVKTDDDMYVDLYEVHTLTRRHLNTSHYLEDRLAVPTLSSVHHVHYAKVPAVPGVARPPNTQG